MVAYYSAHLQDIAQYPDLKMNLFHNFQEIGNAIIFMKMMEQCLAVEEVCDLLHASPFQNIIPKPHVKRKNLSVPSWYKGFLSLIDDKRASLQKNILVTQVPM